MSISEKGLLYKANTNILLSMALIDINLQRSKGQKNAEQNGFINLMAPEYEIAEWSLQYVWLLVIYPMDPFNRSIFLGFCPKPPKVNEHVTRTHAGLFKFSIASLERK